jgi:hypothetical protein
LFGINHRCCWLSHTAAAPAEVNSGSLKLFHNPAKQAGLLLASPTGTVGLLSFRKELLPHMDGHEAQRLEKNAKSASEVAINCQGQQPHSYQVSRSVQPSYQGLLN